MSETIFPHELPFALERAPQAKVLSLDCFDTLLWRDTHAPVGVFTALESVTQGQRIVGETRARKLMRASRGRNEVAIEQIYESILPNAGKGAIAEAVDAELEAEARCCFGFAPAINLMRAAKAKGMAIVIASDTYLSAAQLGELIEVAAGPDVRDLIDRIFCSSQLGLSKSEGMLAQVVKKLKVSPTDVLHIGDNPKADYQAARALGIPALHLLQFTEAAKQRLRHDASVSAMIAPGRGEPSALQPQRAILAVGEPQISNSAEALGFTALGPVFHAFNQWLEGEAAALERSRGGRVHWLFLMRDGHLPREMRRTVAPDDPGAAIELSRYVAIASSLTSRAAIERHAGLELGLKPSTLARQMLFDEKEVAQFDLRADQGAAALELDQELRNGKRQKAIQRSARELSQRMVKHIRRACNPDKGDTLMLVDLGYNGSAQNRVDALLQQELGVHVAGRYLLLREMDAPGLDKKGLIDARHCEPQFLEALSANVAVLEQLSTTAMGSVVDYTEEGAPIRSEPSVKGAQSEVRERVQTGCIGFAKKAQAGLIVRRDNCYSARAWREAATAGLARLMYLPLPRELEAVREFEHDVNLGSERMVALFDPEQASQGLKRRGLFYMKGAERMYLPAEIAQEDIALRLSHFAQAAFGMGFTYADSSASLIDLPVIYLNGEEASEKIVKAVPTHDGFFSVRLPIGAARYSVALQLGAGFEWVEVDNVSASPLAALKSADFDRGMTRQVPVHFDGIEQRGPGIYECLSDHAILLVNAPQLNAGEEADGDWIIEIVFRPLVRRAAAISRDTTLTDFVQSRQSAA